MFTDVARRIAGGSPPVWLTQALGRLAGQLSIIASNAESDPLRAEVHARFQRVKDATAKMERALDGIRDAILWMTFEEMEALDSARQALRAAAQATDSASNRIPRGSGMNRASRLGGLNSRESCAVVVVEAWELMRGNSPRGPNNPQLQEICDEYWRACGMPPIGETGEPSNWRRPLMKALSNNSAFRQFVRDELSRGLVRNPAKNIGDPVP